jgi:hypothetical protein
MKKFFSITNNPVGHDQQKGVLARWRCLLCPNSRPPPSRGRAIRGLDPCRRSPLRPSMPGRRYRGVSCRPHIRPPPHLHAVALLGGLGLGSPAVHLPTGAEVPGGLWSTSYPSPPAFTRSGRSGAWTVPRKIPAAAVDDRREGAGRSAGDLFDVAPPPSRARAIRWLDPGSRGPRCARR